MAERVGKIMEHPKEEFFKIAKEKFGDKIVVHTLGIYEEDLPRFNKDCGTDFTLDDFLAYGEHAWVKGEGNCPKCGDPTSWCLSWSLQHGVMHCGCGALFRYYHYLKPNTKPIRALSLIGF